MVGIGDRGMPAKYQTFTGNPKEDDKAGTNSKGYSVDEAVEALGFGLYQVKMGFVAGFAWVADGMEIMVLSILGPTLLCEWNINTTQEAFITTVVFIGFLVGSAAFGAIADRFGRRNSLLISSVWVLVFGLASAVSPDLIGLLILRFLVGFGVGGGPQAVTYYSEFLPSKARGKAIILVEVFWALGGFLEVVLALLLMRFGWRWWLAASALPVIVFVVLCFWMPKSPRYQLASGQVDEATKTLEKIAQANKASLPEGDLTPGTVGPRGRVQDLIKPGSRVMATLLAILWFLAEFMYYGAILFTTELIKAGDTCKFSGNVTIQDGHCEELTTADYETLLWTSAAELPGLFLTLFLVDLIGRKWTMILEFVTFSIVSFLLFICMSRVPMVVLLFIGRAVCASTVQVLFVYTPEVYPTEVRAMSVGMGSLFGRLGAIVTPYVAQVLLAQSPITALGVYAGAGLLAAIGSALLPFETKGMEMAETH